MPWPCPLQVRASPEALGSLRQEARAQGQGRTHHSSAPFCFYLVAHSSVGQKPRLCVAGFSIQGLRRLKSKYLPSCIPL